IFSSKVIREIRSATRCSTGSAGLRYGTSCACVEITARKNTITPTQHSRTAPLDLSRITLSAGSLAFRRARGTISPAVNVHDKGFLVNLNRLRQHISESIALSALSQSVHLLVVVFFLALTSGCKARQEGGGKNGPIRIGFSMDSLQLERWQRDRDLFTQRAKELGGEVFVQSADGNDSVQVRQAENLL